MHDYRITDFGAKGDGKTDCTRMIQHALDACAAEHGERVVIPSGCFVTGTLRLPSEIELHFSPGSILYSAADYACYPEIHSDAWHTEYAPRKNSRCLIYAENAHYFAITGSGTICCHGADWCEEDSAPSAVNLWRRRTNDVIPRVLMLVNCDHFILSDFCIQDSPAGWAAWLVACSEGYIRHLNIVSDRRMPNADGLHLNACCDMTISDCNFNTGDDALIIRDYLSPLLAPVPCERITVSNCLLSSHSNAIRIGWCNDGTIRDCSVSDCIIHDSTCGITIQLPHFTSRVADQGTDDTVITSLSFHNILMRNVYFEPIHITALPGSGMKEISHICFSGITAQSRLPVRINGLPEDPIESVAFSDCSFELMTDLSTPYPIPAHYWNQEAYNALPFLSHVKKLSLHHTELSI